MRFPRLFAKPIEQHITNIRLLFDPVRLLGVDHALYLQDLRYRALAGFMF